VLNLINFSAFLKCYNTGREQADNVARTLLLDTNVTFQAAKDANELSSSISALEEEEENREEEEKIM
jgi:hypothetical protein